MSDSPQPPPTKPKPGSLRDRIAAFEKPVSSSSMPKPPSVRPKPGNITWKPAPPSPPSNVPEFNEKDEKKSGGMSASDAKESISKAGSLKERMAALQGKAAFGGGLPPAAPPVGPKPMKRPPLVVPPPPREESEEQVTDATEDKPGEVRTGSRNDVETQDYNVPDTAGHGVEELTEDKGELVEDDEEAKERERRAAIAARMARLGGARVGMGPPVFGRKPELKEKPKVVPASDAQANQMIPVDASEKDIHVDEQQGVRPSPSLDSSSPLSGDSVSQERGRVGSDEAQTMTGEKEVIKDIMDARTPPSIPPSTVLASESLPTLDPESRPTPNEPLPQRYPNTSSRSVPSSIPMPAAPRRAAPPRNRKKQEEDSRGVSLVPVDPQDPATKASSGGSTTSQAQPLLARQDPIPQHESTTEHGTLGGSEPPSIQTGLPEDQSEDQFTAPSADEFEEGGDHTQIVPQSEEASHDESHEIDGGPEFQTEDSLKAQAEAHMFVADVSVAESMPEIQKPDEPSHSLILEQDGHEPQSSEEVVTGARHMEAQDLISAREVEDAPVTDQTFESEPDIRINTLAASPTLEAEEEKDVSPTQDQTDSSQFPLMSTEDEIEEDEAARRSRIAERLAKMGGRNPFTTNLFAAAHPPRKVSEDESHEPSHASSHGKSSVAEPDQHTAVETEVFFEASSIDFESHEVHGQDAFVKPLAQGQTGIVNVAEGSFEEPEGDETWHEPALIPPQSQSEEPVENIIPEHDGFVDSEEIDEAFSPVVTPAMPFIPHQVPTDEKSIHPPPVEPSPKRLSQRRSIDSPLEESSVIQDELTVEDEDSSFQVQSASPDEADVTPQAPTLHPAPATGTAVDIEAGNDFSILPPSSPIRLPQPYQMAPAPSNITGSTEFRSPISPSRRSLPSPPRRIPDPPDENPDAGAEPLSTSPRRAVSPPARPPPVPPIPRSMTSPISPTRPQLPSEQLRISTRTLSHPIGEAMSSAKKVTSPTIAVTLSTSVTADAATPQPVVLPKSNVQADSRESIEEQEVLAESEPDPVDPAIISPPRSPATPRGNPQFKPQMRKASNNSVEDAEQSQRQTIAERMAKLGGIQFGAPLVPRRPVVPPQENQPDYEDSKGVVEEQSNTGDDTVHAEPVELVEPESEEVVRARRQAIAARLAGMGGLRFGMLPQMPSSSSHPREGSGDSARTAHRLSHPPQRLPSPPAEAAAFEGDLGSVSDDGVKVEAESEMSIEEVHPEEAEEEGEKIPPPLPSRSSRPSQPPPSDAPPPLPGGRRPPVPSTPLSRRPPIPKIESERHGASGSSRKASSPPVSSVASSAGDYIIVDDVPPPPRSQPPRAKPPPAPISNEPDSSPWELPEIPKGSFDISVPIGLGMEESISLEDSTTYPSPPPSKPHVEPVPEPAARPEKPLSADELLQLGGVVGAAVHAAASALFDKSKKSIVGDGTSRGFVNAVLAKVPQASKASYGHLVYSQTGSSVLRRSSNIMPGDIVELTDAKLKGHKGLQSYHQTAGTAEEPLVGVVSEFEGKKSKIRVLQASQHVGSQTVEVVSYRLDDLKSGSLKVFRVASA